MKRVTLTLLAFLAVICGLGLLGQWMLPEAQGQASRVNVHMYSSQALAQDSAATYPILLLGIDRDTTETFYLSTYANLSTIFKFNFVSRSHADSISMCIYLQVTIDDTTWSTVDSIEAATITVAKLVEYSGTDTSYMKSWTFPRAKTGRIIFASLAANSGGNTETDQGVYVRPKIFKQQ